jgi:glycosyltransferase involved in cell wall biosynthesis
MKIALLVPSWPPGLSPNGIVTYASQLVPALRKLDHEVFVLTVPQTKDHNDPYIVDLEEFSPAPSLWNRAEYKLVPEYAAFKAGSARITSAIKRLIAQHDVDVFEIEESFGWSFEASRLNLLPIVIRLHGPWFLNARFAGGSASVNKRRQEREGRALQSAAFVTSPSDKMLRAVKTHYGFSVRASRVIPNPLAAAAPADRWSLETCSTDTLLFVGRFDLLKGGDLVLRVFVELASYYRKLRLVFVGPDRGIRLASGKTQSFEQFVKIAVPHQTRPRIEFLGQLTREDVRALRPKCFITVVASQQEMMPYSVLEAMSIGCPIVATDVGGIPELIRDFGNGLLVPSSDVSAMARACRLLLDDHTLAARLGRQAWEDCRDLYAPETIADQTVEVYQRAIDAFKSVKMA